MHINKMNKSIMKYVLLLFLILSLALVSCNSKAESKEVKEINYKIPKPWVRETPSDQIKYEQYLLPGYEGSGSAELSVYKFPNKEQGGNYLEHWFSMIKQPDGTYTKDVAEKDSLNQENLLIKTFRADGTRVEDRKPVMMGGEKNILRDYELFVAVVDHRETEWHFRFIGPSKALKYWQPSIEEFLKSISE